MADPAGRLEALKARLAAARAAKSPRTLGEEDVVRLAMRYCGPRGIPLSVFRGRVVVPGEPEWLQEDFAAALRWQAEEDAKCVGCGQPRTESFDGKARYQVDTYTCNACAVVQQASWLAEKNRPKNGAPKFGRYFTTRKAGGQ